MVKALRHGHRAVMKSINNTEKHPKDQEQNNYQEEVNIRILIIDTFHYRGSRILKPLLPGNGRIPKSTKERTKAKSHFINNKKKIKRIIK
jgi:hypothetical protein